MADNSLIPAGIRDESTLALNELIDRMGTIDLTPLLVYVIDNVHSSALYHLADQFHVMGLEGYSFAGSDEEKRTLLKTAIVNHKYKGTPYSVKNALEALGFVVELTEWQAYNGRPYHFKLKLTSGSQVFAEDLGTRITTMIDEYKNVRSVLDNLELVLSSASNVPYVGGYGITGLCITGGA